MKLKDGFSALLQTFFTDRLIQQQSASPHTIASYRDTFRLLAAYLEQHLKGSSRDLVGRFRSHHQAAAEE